MHKIIFLSFLLFTMSLRPMQPVAYRPLLSTELEKAIQESDEHWLLHQVRSVQTRIGNTTFKELAQIWTKDDLEKVKNMLYFCTLNSCATRYVGSAFHAEISPNYVITVWGKNNSTKQANLSLVEFMCCTRKFPDYVSKPATPMPKCVIS